MKRKVILMGGKTYVISLPSTWIRKYSVSKSEELDLEERDNKIVISTSKGKDIEKANIDISNTNTSYAWWALSSAYIKGADEIEVHFSTKQDKELINEVSKALIGFSIVKETSKSIIMKDLSMGVTEFDSMFRRIFFMLKSFIEEGLDYIRDNNFKKLAEHKSKDHDINYAVYYCLRYLNKKGYSNYNETSFIYSTLRELESLGDEYADLFRFVSEKKIKLNKNYVSLIAEVNLLFDSYYQVFYKFDLQQILQVISFKKKMLKERNDLFDKASKEEAVVISYVRSITSLVFNLTEMMMVSRS